MLHSPVTPGRPTIGALTGQDAPRSWARASAPSQSPHEKSPAHIPNRSCGGVCRGLVSVLAGAWHAQRPVRGRVVSAPLKGRRQRSSARSTSSTRAGYRASGRQFPVRSSQAGRGPVVGAGWQTRRNDQLFDRPWRAAARPGLPADPDRVGPVRRRHPQRGESSGARAVL